VITLFAVAGEHQRYTYDSGGQLSDEQAVYDVTYYSLTLGIDPATKSIHGSLSAWAEIVSPTEWLVLDLGPNLNVTDVTSAAEPSLGRLLAYERRGGKLWVQLPRTMSVGEEVGISVEYGGQPRVAPNPPWDGGFTWTQTPDGAP